MKKGEILMWLVIFGAVLAATVGGVIYMTACVGRFGGIKMLAGERKLLRFLLSFGAIALVFAAVSVTMSVMNAVVVFLNEVLFFLIFGGIMKIVTHVSGKEFSVNWQGWLAIAASVVYLVIGYQLMFSVKQKDYTIKTEKNADLRIAMFADSHLGTSFDGEGFAEHLKTIEQQSPDIVLIPGDFVDDSANRADLENACEALGKMNVKYGVWFAYGNHDKGYSNGRDFTADDLERIMKNSGIHVLEDEYELVDDSFYVVGRSDSSVEGRKTMDALLEGIDTSKYIVVLDHEPNDYENEAASAADLVVSGHTHGGQLVPITYVGEWFGINDRTYGHEKRNNTDFIVTSGISCWEILFKTGTRSEYVIIDVSK